MNPILPPYWASGSLPPTSAPAGAGVPQAGTRFMKFDDRDQRFLRGDEFSNAYALSLDKPREPVLRVAMLEDLVRDKRILDFGFADHLPLLEQKRAEGTWLHGRLRAAAAECVGLDNEKEAVDHLRDIVGLDDVYTFDLFSDVPPTAVESRHYDYIVLGEVLEHTNDPVAFLRAMHDKFGHLADRIVITVPNAFRIHNFLAALRRKELINSDHRFWFTPYTLAKVVSESGWQVEECVPCSGFTPRRMAWLQRFVFRRWPILQEGLYLIARS